MPRSKVTFANVCAQIFLTLALVIAVALLAPISDVALAQANPPPPLDHYRCYPLIFGPEPVPRLVFLQDQFDIRRQIVERVALRPPTRFCNPVEKQIDDPRSGASVVTPITDPRVHLALYPIRDTVPHRPVVWNVVVKNQFGTHKLLAKRPRFLGVPSWKEPTPNELGTLPSHPDHFKCYDAVGEELSIKATLIDQFEAAQVVVLDPKLFCNPTRKMHEDGTAFPVANAVAHLTCYDLIEVPTGPFSVVSIIDHVIRNQFTPSTGDIQVITDEDLLCVPSRKVTFSATGPTIAADVDFDAPR